MVEETIFMEMMLILDSGFLIPVAGSWFGRQVN
jgi:hypothetical protein